MSEPTPTYDEVKEALGYDPEAAGKYSHALFMEARDQQSWLDLALSNFDKTKEKA